MGHSGRTQGSPATEELWSLIETRSEKPLLSKHHAAGVPLTSLAGATCLVTQSEAVAPVSDEPPSSDSRGEYGEIEYGGFPVNCETCRMTG